MSSTELAKIAKSDVSKRTRKKAASGPVEASADGVDRSDVSAPVDATTEVLSDSVAGPGGGSTPEPGKTAALVEAEHEHLDEIRKLNAKVREYRSEYEDAAAEAKSRKKSLEAAQDQLSDLIARGPETMPLFDGPKPAAKPGPKPKKAAAPDEVWRADIIPDLDLAPSIVEKLAEAGLHTIGDLADWSAGGRLLQDIDGIGEAAAVKIDDAMTKYWSARSTTSVVDDETA